MKVFIDDPALGHREVIGNLGLIKDQLKLLEHFRDDGRVPTAHLLTDIKVYQFILKSADPEGMANLYMSEADRIRTERKTFSVKKSEVAANLGWNIA